MTTRNQAGQQEQPQASPDSQTMAVSLGQPLGGKDGDCEDISTEKDEPSTADNEPSKNKECILPKPTKPTAMHPELEGFPNLVASMKAMVPSAAAHVDAQNGKVEHHLEIDQPKVSTHGAKPVVPMPTGSTSTTKGFSNLGQTLDQNGPSTLVDNLGAHENQGTCDVSGAIFATLDGSDEENSLSLGGQSLQTLFRPDKAYNPMSIICLIGNVKTGQTKKVRAVFDSCSTISLVTKGLADELGLRSESDDLTMRFVTTGGSVRSIPDQYRCSFFLMSLNKEYRSPTITAGTLPRITRSFNPPVLDVATHEHLRNVTDYREDYKREQGRIEEVSALIGVPYEFLITGKKVFGPRPMKDPILCHTKLGSCISTSTLGNKRFSHLSLTFDKMLEQDMIQKMFSLESVGIMDCPSQNNGITLAEQKCEKKVLEGTTYDASAKRYTTSLPWLNWPIDETNREVAWQFAKKLMKKLKPEQLQQFQATYKDGLDRKFFVRLTKEELEQDCGHWIVTFPVFQDDKPLHACRLVWMANQPMKISKRSFNQHLAAGYNNVSNLVIMLIKFRAAKWTMIGDISRMYHKFAVNYDDSLFLKFVAITEDEEGKPRLEACRSQTLPFGLVSSGFIATLLMREHVKKYLDDPKYEKSARQLLTHVYVDDIISVGETEEELMENVQRTREILDDASLGTYKYSSNSKRVLSVFPPELVSPKTETTVLGMTWNTEKDTITLKLVDPAAAKTSPTKRNVLSTCAQIYDPMGLASPHSVFGRMILQKCWEDNVEWDQELNEPLKQQFLEFCEQLPRLEEVTTSRCLLADEKSRVIGIYTFVDGSTKAYACAVFVVTQDEDGTKHSNLVFAKGKVRPLSQRFERLEEWLSVARMELLAANLGASMGTFVRSAFDDDADIDMKWFSDSQITLWRILKDPSEFRPFVGNRLAAILEKTKPSQWYWCCSEDNFAADAISRGFLLNDFFDNEEYWHGPSFLTSPETNFAAMNIENIQLKKNVAQFEAAERKATLVSHGLPFYRWCKNPWKWNPPDWGAWDEPPIDDANGQIESQNPNEDESMSHGLFLEGNVEDLDQEFFDFWYLKNESEPKNGGMFQRFESWNLLWKVTGRIIQFIVSAKGGWAKKATTKPTRLPLNLKINEHERNRPILNMCACPQELLKTARLTLFRIPQHHRYRPEITCVKSKKKVSYRSTIKRLCPWWDEQQSIMRMRGRLPASSLIILPPRDPLTEIFVRGVHTAHCHIAKDGLMTRVESQGVYIVGSVREYKRIIRCCICRPLKPVITEEAKLPLPRTVPNMPVMTWISCDYAGPIYWYDGKGSPQKSWLMVVSCLISRFIHCEVVTRCTTVAFIQAFRTISALYGCPIKVYSDSAGIFKQANAELKEILRSMKWHEIQAAAAADGFEWDFAPPFSPAKNGISEAAVKLTKTALEKALRFNFKGTPRRFDLEQLRVLVYECISLVNDRALGPISFDKDGGSSLVHVTPSLLVKGRPGKPLPVGMRLKDAVQEGMNVSMLYRHRTQVIKMFWQEWEKNYLRQLKFVKRYFEKWPGKKVPVGTMVLLREKNVNKPGKFTTAVVVDTYARPDGTVSRFLLKTAGNKNPVVRDARKVHLTEHTFLSLTEKNHHCLVKGWSSPVTPSNDQSGTRNDPEDAKDENPDSVISVPLSTLTIVNGDAGTVSRLMETWQSARFHVIEESKSRRATPQHSCEDPRSEKKNHI